MLQEATRAINSGVGWAKPFYIGEFNFVCVRRAHQFVFSILVGTSYKVKCTYFLF